MENFRNCAEQLDLGFAKSVSALITALGMHWTNQERIQNGYSPAYDEDSFLNLIDEFGIEESDVRDRYHGL
ncbi:hypothetical protein LEP1GSC185_0974 [Leptospira licerasiae serovar Varillal str. VAR 010]|nr:hypothetical protein LEP1GSC185_0974 [Leptospira licerasiae serovar Varillal str. VAR 010]